MTPTNFPAPPPVTAKPPLLGRKRPLYFVIFILVALIALIAISWANFEFGQETIVISEVKVPIEERADKVRIQLEFGDTKRAFEGPISPGMKIKNALEEVATVGALDLRIKNGAILALAGQETSRVKAWQVYLNGLEVDDLEEEVHGGDRVILRYE